MAVYRIFPESDTFIFSESQKGNAGKDEILEIAGYEDFSGTGRAKRTLIKFSTTEIQNVVNNKIGSNSWNSNVKLYLAEANEVPVSFEVYGYPISTTWDNGVGKFGDLPVNKSGASWQYRGAEETNAWTTTGFSAGTTGSYITGQAGGGTWFTGSAGIDLEFSQSFALNADLDLNINVTNATELFYSESISNNGFIFKLSNDLEFNVSRSVQLRFFGVDTNTIYPPSLEFKWDDSSYDTGSLSVLSNSQAQINVKNNKGEYVDEGKQRFRLSAKPTYPARTFTTSSVYLTNYALPATSYWALRDENTEEMVVDFDTSYTKISCDSTGPYFDVHMDGLQPERYYRLLIKTTLDGSTTVVDNKNIFKIVRNG